ncbi:hypothetical protein [Desulfomonile tiedjei]|uniref:DUF304 domain-containing protein n=1 Tax=Desulfomonile tiedjei (strain ATCC 49306 / DSM 6799 / DCB-1) TaxID=706587 RepID=I4C523_DESTA|nr:hypothetical protein [Desulfomonile tiedjei]AFM24664.1 hypothetical protein Desti_1958 [Desulfomonile tiedjei DSM 6799]
MKDLLPFKQVSHHCVEVRQGGGIISLGGILLFGAGVLVTLAAVGIVPLENLEEMFYDGWPSMLLTGAICFAVGGCLAFGREWTTIDVSCGSLTRQWGLLIPMKTTNRSLRTYHSVVIRLDPGDSDTRDMFSVVLKSRSGSNDLMLYYSNKYGEARARAAFLAKFLRLPLKEGGTGEESVTLPDELEDSFQDRIGRGEVRHEKMA